MTKIVASYTPSSVECSILGILLEGFTPDKIVEITKDEATNTIKKAMDGSITTTLNSKPTYKVTFYLQSTSPSNDWIHLLHKLAELHGNVFKMPILIKDKSGSTFFFSSDLVFDNVPTTSLTNKTEESAWSFTCANCSFTKGGNVEDYQLLETLQYLKQALEIADMFGFNLGEFESKISQFSTSAFNQLKNKF